MQGSRGFFSGRFILDGRGEGLFGKGLIGLEIAFGRFLIGGR
jgi:hypothetical protein